MDRSAQRPEVAWVRILAASCSALAVLAACGEPERSRELPAPREIVLADSAPKLHAPANERFALNMPGASAAPTPARELDWDTPEGWSEAPPTSMRLANFRVAGDERAECYLTALAGDAGGLAANVNRWCTQMSQRALSAEELEALPRAELFGREAVLLDVEGTWTGMSGAERVGEQRLVGLLLVDAGGSLFLKMVGPSALLAEQRESFLALARSFQRANPH